MIRNETTALKKCPYLKTEPLIVNFSPAKSGLPPMAAISGVTTSATKAVTTAPNAAPMTTATARSTTLPRRTNSRNCLSMPPRSRSVPALLLDGRDQPLTRREPRHVLAHAVAQLVQLGALRIGHVRRDDGPRRGPQRVPVRQRLGVRDVQRGAADPLVLQRRDQRVGVDQRPAGDVDDPRVRP